MHLLSVTLFLYFCTLWICTHLSCHEILSSRSYLFHSFANLTNFSFELVYPCFASIICYYGWTGELKIIPNLEKSNSDSPAVMEQWGS